MYKMGVTSYKKKLVYYVVGWILVNKLCGGCPLSYLDQWAEVRAGIREEISYTYEDSIAAQVIGPIRSLFAEGE